MVDIVTFQNEKKKRKTDLKKYRGKNCIIVIKNKTVKGKSSGMHLKYIKISQTEDVG